MQGWTIGMDPDSDPDLSLFIAVMALVIGVMTLLISIMALIGGLVLRLMASLIVHATQIVYITFTLRAYGLNSNKLFSVEFKM